MIVLLKLKSVLCYCMTDSVNTREGLHPSIFFVEIPQTEFQSAKMSLCEQRLNHTKNLFRKIIAGKKKINPTFFISSSNTRITERSTGVLNDSVACLLLDSRKFYLTENILAA